MLKQVTMEEALERVRKGETVRCLIPGADPECWEGYTPGDLGAYLAGVIPMVEEAPPREGQGPL